MKAPPYSIGQDALIVAYYASAEMGCHLSLDWRLPINVLDLYVEFRTLTNGLKTPSGAGLLGALVWFGLDSIDAVEKKEMQQLAMRGGPYTVSEKQTLLDYCESDVEALAKLLPKMEPSLDITRALLRGRYMKAAAHIEHTGVPIDTDKLALLRENWCSIQEDLIEEIDANFGIYEGRTFKANRFAEWLIRYDIPWPRLASGVLDLSDDTFKEMARSYPAITSLRELRGNLSQMRLSDLSVGHDGRNRCLISPFRARTGRNQPSTSKFIFGPSVWYRSLIQPELGHGLAYIDWSQQEFGIAAALSGDHMMMAAYESGDPYLEFAKQAQAISQDATKETHKAEREQFKACVLAVQYGMGAESLAYRIGQPVLQAKELLKLHRQTYRVFWQWSDSAVDYAMLYGNLSTVFGWTIHVGTKSNPRSLRNFPMQANGAEILRLACCLATERGIRLCAPVHDAVLIEAPLDDLERAISVTQSAMAEASRIVLDGFQLRTEVEVVRYPARYTDPRGKVMWDTVMEIIRRNQARVLNEATYSSLHASAHLPAHRRAPVPSYI
jgi:hypothetical protein